MSAEIGLALVPGLVAALGVLVLLWRSAAGSAQAAQLQRDNERLGRELRESHAAAREQLGQGLRELREEQSRQFGEITRTLGAQLGQMTQVQTTRLDGFGQQISNLMRSSEDRLDQLRTTVELRLKELQADNTRKLEEMRATVDEKLHKTLEERLSQSFNLVTERLEQVHKGLGEMQTLAAGVGDLKRVLTNVKTRGIWGEVQLGALLEQVFAPGQYERDVVTRRGSRDRVEYAIRLPGRDPGVECVYLPIDAKFPQEDYQRLIEAHERADQRALEESARALEATVRNEAKTIRDKYLDPPATTDFGILFLPTEGLYAEVLRRPGLVEDIQRQCRVIVAGPTTLAALLNSLQVGFRTLAIEKRTSEVWSILGAVKTEFLKFADVLEKTRRKLDEASNTIGQAETRTRQIGRKLKSVEALPEPATGLLGLEDSAGLALEDTVDEGPAEAREG